MDIARDIDPRVPEAERDVVEAHALPVALGGVLGSALASRLPKPKEQA